MKIQEKLREGVACAKSNEKDISFFEESLKTKIEDFLEKKSLGKEIAFVIERPVDEKFGDYATNVAMLLAGVLKKKALEIAEEILKEIDFSDLVLKTEIVAPGFINFRIKNSFYFKELEKVLVLKEKYAAFCNSDIKNPQKIMVEFGQPNTHKAFTVGHIKGAISGLAICQLIENLGYQVIKTNYYGDIGMHTAKSTWGLMKKGLPDDFDDWDKHKKMEFIAEAYVYATENFEDNEQEIRKINLDIYQGKKNEATELYEKIKKWSLEHQEDLFFQLGIKYEKQYPESQVFEEAKRIVEENKNKIFEKSQGAFIYDGEKDGLATWVVETSEGNPTYLAKDLALGFKKFNDFPDLYFNLTLTGVEQKDHFKAVIKILEKLDEKFKDRYFHQFFGWLLMDGKKTSSRSGKNIKGTDILEEALLISKNKIAETKDYDEKTKEDISRKVALAGIKFLILSNDFNKNVNYDPKKFMDFEGYSGPYILYAYVRAKSILKKSISENISLNNLEKNNLNEYEEKLLKFLTKYPNIAFRSGIELAPHLMCNYLYELATRFNSFYAHCPVLDASEEEKKIRLDLAEASAQILKNGLTLLGIETVEEM